MGGKQLNKTISLLLIHSRDCYKKQQVLTLEELLYIVQVLIGVLNAL